MKTKHGFRGFFGVLAKLPLALAVLLIFAVSACDDGPDSGKTGNDLKLPTDLQNTEWVHTGGDRVKFGTNTVTVIPVSGTEKTFTLKDSVTVSELSQTTLYFGDSQISDFILCRDGTISSVFLGGVEKAYGWQKVNGGNNNGNNPTFYTVTFNANGGTVLPSSVQVESGKTVWSWPTLAKTTGDTTFWGWYTKNGTTSGDWGNLFTTATPVTADITVYAQWGGKQVEISKNVQLTEANWKAILTEIAGAGIDDVILDLSLCTRSGQYTGGGLSSDGTFDPLYNFSTGKDRISSLILPNAATSIVESSNSSFRSFSNLTSVSSPTVTDIGRRAFFNCIRLTSVNFPAVASIGEYAFSYCYSLNSVSFPAAIIIGDSFRDCTSLKSVSFPAATSIGAYAFGGCISLTDVSLPAATSINGSAFRSTGTTAMTIILKSAAPQLSYELFAEVPSKTVTVKVPSGATGYGTISQTYSGNDTTANWGNGFRGGGWDGTTFINNGGASKINSNITLHIQYQ
jgi:hypothetical protein